jgi:PKD repeat protein
MKYGVWCALVLVLGLTWSATAQARWYKGNTHCHTEVSPDSGSPQEQLFAWYKSHDYDFVIPTEHNRYHTREHLASLEAWDEALGRVAPLVDEGFLLIPGEELTTSEHHINGLDLPSRVSPASTIGAAFELLWANGALPQLNHPEYNYLQSRQIIEELSELDGPMLLEIYNAHPLVVRRSGPSSEDIWDAVLSTGRLMWGVAVDDAHTLEGGETPPGGGYIYVDAPELTTDAILGAIEQGRFYASTGATLADFSWTASYYEVDAPGASQITFLGRGGRTLEVVRGEYASYDFRGDELYVRARIESPQGFAWTQPVYVSALPQNDAPVAQLEASILRGPAPLRVRLDGRGSSDPDGEVVTWRWDFGDGDTGRGEVISHTYDAPGVYQAELTVFDEQGDLGRAMATITVLEPGAQEPDMGGQDMGGQDTGADMGTEDAGQEDAGQEDQGDDAEPAQSDSDPVSPALRQSRQGEGCATAAGGSMGAQGGLWWLFGAVIWWRRRRRV